MLLVRPHIGVSDLGARETNDFIEDLFKVCREIVPAAMNSPMRPLTPGSIEFIPVFGFRRGLTVDVLVEIEAFPFEDRENLDERAEAIRASLSELFPGKTFAVWPKLVKAGWASDSTNPEFDGDMSNEAAFERALSALEPEMAAASRAARPS